MSFDISDNSALQTACVIEARSFKYKAKIASVSPLAKRNEFELSGRCFLGISLENSHFYPQKLAGILEWISRRFAQCTVLVGDSIHRLTLQSVHNLQPPVAMVAALALGERFIRENQPVFDRFSTATRFRFLTCHGVQAQVGYQYFHRQLLQLYRTDARFNQSVKRFAEHYLRKKFDLLEPSEWARQVAFSADYFLEEFAIFACLQQQGHSVMIYPGSFSTLSEIAQGLHPLAPEELKALTIVSLCVKGR
jgi:tRNA-dependent cyclodipeptide synthase